LTAELAELIDDEELTADELYKLYRSEGGEPLRTIADNVMDALQAEQERVQGTADGFRADQ
jgi:propanediol dehydratase small subunit